MDDFGAVARHWLSALAMLLLDDPKDFRQLRRSFFGCRHQRMASGKSGDFGHPAIGLVAVEHYFIVVEAHVPSFYFGQPAGAPNGGPHPPATNPPAPTLSASR
jgi:hypothetical protein